MKNNVISIKQNTSEEVPNDLMRFVDACEKFGIKYCTLYKYTRLLQEIPYYNKGGLKVSESEVKNWLKMGLVPARS